MHSILVNHIGLGYDTIRSFTTESFIAPGKRGARSTGLDVVSLYRCPAGRMREYTRQGSEVSNCNYINKMQLLCLLLTAYCLLLTTYCLPPSFASGAAFSAPAMLIDSASINSPPSTLARASIIASAMDCR